MKDELDSKLTKNNRHKYTDSPSTPFLYIEETIGQAKKTNQNVCGDYYQIMRTKDYTAFVLADGIGSGIKANIAAIMCTNRIMKLLSSGISLQKTCDKVVAMMQRARTEDNIPFTAFTIVWILNNGQYTIISYESPPPILIKDGIAEVLPQKHMSVGLEIVSKATGALSAKDTLVLTSDGVTQAGLGIIRGLGWGQKNLVCYLNRLLTQNKSLNFLVENLLRKVYQLSGDNYNDDTSIATLTCREAHILNIMTGPAVSPKDDQEFVEHFRESSGIKAVCGSTTAEIVARVLGEKVEVVNISASYARPPQYSIPGVDIVTEGAVTLNQVYNILDEDESYYDKESCVSIIAQMMKKADIIRLFVGESINKGHEEMTFKQLGVLPRKTIVNLIIRKLNELGKTVIIYNK